VFLLKVLFIIPYNFIPPDSGNKNLLFALLKGVSSHVECDLVILSEAVGSFVKSRILNEFPHVKEIYLFAKPSGLNLLRSRLKFMFAGFHHALGRYRNVALEKWLESHADCYSLIHFDMIHVAPYRVFCGSVPTILVASDAYSMAVRSARHAGRRGVIETGYLLVQEWWFRRFERINYPWFDIVCTVSEIDAAWLKSLAPGANIRTVGIGLAAEFTERSIKHLIDPNLLKKKILCTGNLNHSVIADAMINFLRNIVPIMLREHPDLSVTILGQAPVPELKLCMEEFGSVVTHISFVDDYADFLDDDWVYVYPQECASGLQTKVQQAMALGLPVVGLIVSFGGLRVETGKHCFICNDIWEMKKNVSALIKSSNLRRQIGLAASTHVKEQFSIKRTGDEMLRLYQEVAEK
jgi:polysaccharide biosynthesis protein PslH